LLEIKKFLLNAKLTFLPYPISFDLLLKLFRQRDKPLLGLENNIFFDAVNLIDEDLDMLEERLRLLFRVVLNAFKKHIDKVTFFK
jgi:hypothetical protein